MKVYSYYTHVYRLQELHSSCNKLLSCLCSVLAKMREESDSSVTFVEELLIAALPALHCKLYNVEECSINLKKKSNFLFYKKLNLTLVLCGQIYSQ